MRIKEIRASKNIQQKELAIALGIGTSTLSQYENGKREPDIATLKKIADELMVSVDYLIGRTEKEPASKNRSGLNETEKQIMEYVSQMPEQEQEAFLAWLQASHGHD